MDFALTQEQEALRELAHKILADHVTQERLRIVESGTEWFDARSGARSRRQT